jgi:hypothetical protein
MELEAARNSGLLHGRQLLWRVALNLQVTLHEELITLSYRKGGQVGVFY